MRFVPMDFCEAECSIPKADTRLAFHFSPTAFAVAALQAPEITNSSPRSNGFENRDFAKNLEVHTDSMPVEELAPLRRITSCSTAGRSAEIERPRAARGPSVAAQS